MRELYRLSGGRPLAHDFLGSPVEMNRIAIDGSDEVDRDEMVKASGCRILLRQFDLAVVDMIDRSDMHPIRADHLGMLLDLCDVDHAFHSRDLLP